MSWAEYNYVCSVNGDVESWSCNLSFVPTKVLFGDETFPTQAYIDSGCNTTLASSDIAEFLGIDLTMVETSYVHGIGGIAAGKKARVRLQIDDLGEPYETEVVFIKNLQIQLVLGQEPFFELFDIRFEKSRRKFFLRRAD